MTIGPADWSGCLWREENNGDEPRQVRRPHAAEHLSAAGRVAARGDGDILVAGPKGLWLAAEVPLDEIAAYELVSRREGSEGCGSE